MRKINAGEYRHIIIFQELTNKRNDYGEIEKEWKDVYKTKAAIYPLSSKELFQAGVISNETTHKIYLRYSPRIKNDMRIKFKDRYFSIISIINFEEKNRELQLLCRELGNGEI
ncbi:MAG: phage head closure protein [Caloramator sp.]|nr:phage head closure protein [Caloramator sp.]